MDKVIFVTHINSKGQLREGKQVFKCPHCGGECFVAESYVTPRGIEHSTFNCTDCDEEWEETYP